MFDKFNFVKVILEYLVGEEMLNIVEFVCMIIEKLEEIIEFNIMVDMFE